MDESVWSRRNFIGGASAMAVAGRSGFAFALPERAPTRLLLGTQGKVSKGIYAATFDEKTGALGPIELAVEVAAPTFLATHEEGGKRYVYAVSEVDGPGAAVTSFGMVDDGAKLWKVNEQPSEGSAPTHLSLTPDGRVLAVANYDGGSVTTYRVGTDGRISEPVSHMQYTGRGPNAERQMGPHAHSAQFSPDGRWLLVNDLGLDRIVIYRVDGATGTITANDPAFFATAPGAGPRHVAFHPNGRWVYSVNEMGNTVDQLLWDTRTGQLKELSSVSTLPAGFVGKAQAGEILCSHDGRQVYVGNRIAADTIAVMNVNAATGALTLKQLATNGGKNTRHIALDRTGRWMVVSNQGSGSVVVLERNVATGALSEPRSTYTLDTVMFALFI